nr:cytochrome c [Actibacterium lipolyticum]
MRPAPQTDTHAIATAAEPLAGAPIVEVALPADLSASAKLGKRGFDAVCAACHGENGSGRQGMGPPLVHKIYEPSHHGDMAFLMAVQRGVRAHHWPFGNMPPQQGLTEGDVKAITAYVRELQQANGIN